MSFLHFESMNVSLSECFVAMFLLYCDNISLLTSTSSGHNGIALCRSCNFHDWTLAFYSSDSKKRVVYKGKWVENQPTGDSEYSLSALYSIKGSISKSTYSGARVWYGSTTNLSLHDRRKLLESREFKTKRVEVEGEAFRLGQDLFSGLQRCQFAQRNHDAVLLFSDPSLGNSENSIFLLNQFLELALFSKHTPVVGILIPILIITKSLAVLWPLVDCLQMLYLMKFINVDCPGMIEDIWDLFKYPSWA